MKKWEIPTVEALEIASTEWSPIEGGVPDAMYQDCDILYKS